jgi:molybdopterin synthase catalytic subunit
MGRIRAFISDAPLDIAAAHAFVADAGHGAVASFLGVVRDRNEGRPVSGITYDVFLPLAEKTLAEIAAGAGEGVNAYIAHARGYLPVGGVSLVIAVSAAHRAEAFAACRALLEEIKSRAPVWKQEHYADGDSAWLDGRVLSPRPPDSAG